MWSEVCTQTILACGEEDVDKVKSTFAHIFSIQMKKSEDSSNATRKSDVVGPLLPKVFR